MAKAFETCVCIYDNGCDCSCDYDNTVEFETNEIEYYNITDIEETDLDCLSIDALFIAECIESGLL